MFYRILFLKFVIFEVEIKFCFNDNFFFVLEKCILDILLFVNFVVEE